MRPYLLLFFASLLLGACQLKEPLAPQYAAYIGEWESDIIVIEILPNGGAVYDSNRLWDADRIEGYVKFNEEKDKLIIVGLDEDGGRVSLRIDREPALKYDPVRGEIMSMTLDGIELILKN